MLQTLSRVSTYDLCTQSALINDRMLATMACRKGKCTSVGKLGYTQLTAVCSGQRTDVLYDEAFLLRSQHINLKTAAVLDTAERLGCDAPALALALRVVKLRGQ